MAFIAGKNSYFTFSGLLLTNSLASEVGLSGSADELDNSTIGNNWKAFDQGQAEATMAISGVWDDGTATTALDAVLFAALNGGGTKLYEYMPAGSATSKPKYAGNALCTAYEISSPVGDHVGFTLNLRAAGSPTRTISA